MPYFIFLGAKLFDLHTGKGARILESGRGTPPHTHPITSLCKTLGTAHGDN